MRTGDPHLLSVERVVKRLVLDHLVKKVARVNPMRVRGAQAKKVPS